MAAPTTGPAHTPHLARLDVLRSLAFMGVLTFHMTGPFESLKIMWNGNWRDLSHWPPVLYPLLPVNLGWLGVPLFFVLSGFCIHYSTMKRKTPFTIGDFYWRRFLRIYPAYLACVIGGILLMPWIPLRYFNVWQVVTHLLMIHNFFKATFGGINGALWSLGVEMQFYLLYPLLLLVLRPRLSWGGCLAVSLTFNVLLQLIFSLTSQPYEMNHTRPTFSFPLVTWCDWILGAALAEAYTSGQRLFIRRNAWLIGSTVMLLASMLFRPLYVQAFLFGAVFFAVVIERYLSTRAPLWRLERWLAPVGLISYSLYLWHGPVLQLVELWGNLYHPYATPWQEGPYLLIATSVLLFPFAWLSYRVFEVAVPRWLAQAVHRKSGKSEAIVPGVAAK